LAVFTVKIKVPRDELDLPSGRQCIFACYSGGRMPPTRSRRLLLPLAISLIVGAAFAAGVLLTTPRRQAPRLPRAEGPSQAFLAAPDFRLRAFDGRSVALSDFRGKPVVLNFWASWCTPCRQEMPNLERVWKEFREQGLVVLGIDVLDDEKDARAFLKALNITYPNVFDPDQTRMRLYRVGALPTTILIDREQRQRERFVGGYLGEAGYRELRTQVLKLLQASP
jgi:peroxiredoxin